MTKLVRVKICLTLPFHFMNQGQYISTFMVAFQKKNAVEESSIDRPPVSSTKTDSYDPYSTRIMNFFFGIPTNEDLRRYYFWESINVGEREFESIARKKRSLRLTKLWKAQWFGRLEMKVAGGGAVNNMNRQWDWRGIFAIVQGHRFVWWGSEKGFDLGENPMGQIYFAGHSGLATLSPLEMRELKKGEIPLVVNIFGRSASLGGQQTKISLLAPDNRAKGKLEDAIIETCLGKHD